MAFPFTLAHGVFLIGIAIVGGAHHPHESMWQFDPRSLRNGAGILFATLLLDFLRRARDASISSVRLDQGVRAATAGSRVGAASDTDCRDGRDGAVWINVGCPVCADRVENAVGAGDIGRARKQRRRTPRRPPGCARRASGCCRTRRRDRTGRTMERELRDRAQARHRGRAIDAALSAFPRPSVALPLQFGASILIEGSLKPE